MKSSALGEKQFANFMDGESIIIRLNQYFKFIHEPYQEQSDFSFLGREREVQTLAQQILFSDGGAILVTGYRGVGKTSLVNQAVALSKELLPTYSDRIKQNNLLFVHFNLAKEMQPAEVMHHIVRRIYDTLHESEQFKHIDKSTRRLIELAYQRTSMMITRKAGTNQLAEVGLSLPEISLGVANLKSTFDIGRKFSRTTEEEISFLGYDEKAAEYDVIRILKQLSSPTKPRASRQKSYKVVIAFDELDKINPYIQNGDKKISNPYMDQLIGALKGLLTTSGVVFIFITSREIHQRWLSDLRWSDSVYDSVFAHQIYVGLDWAFPQKLLETYRGDQNPLLKGVEASLAGYLGFHARGIARRAYRTLNHNVRWQENGLHVVMGKKTIQLINFYNQLDGILRKNSHQILGAVHDYSASSFYSDEHMNFSYRLSEAIIETGGQSFSISELLHNMQDLTTWIGKQDDLVALANLIVDVLVTNSIVEPIRDRPSGFACVIGTGREASFEEPHYRLAEWVLLKLHSLRQINVERNEVSALRTLGNYELTHKIGEGGFSEVYIAYDLQQHQQVAIKLARENRSEDTLAREILNLEGRLLEKLKIPGIVKLIESKTSTKPYFLVLEYIDGIDLKKTIQTVVGGFDLGDALSLIYAAAEPVIALHDLEIVQLDIKPANFMLTRNGEIRLIDLSGAIDPTLGGAIKRVPIGTPEYAAPELTQNNIGDIKSDVYSFGLLMHELLTGGLPTPNAMKILRSGQRQRSKATEALSSRRYSTERLGALPDPIRSVLGRALALKPETRYSSVAALITELRQTFPFPPSSSISIANQIFSSVEQYESAAHNSTRVLLADLVNIHPVTSIISKELLPQATGKDTGEIGPGLSDAVPQPIYTSALPLTNIPSSLPETNMVLIGLTSPFNGKYRLDNERIKIGRLPDNQIVLNDEQVSRIHAELGHRDDGHWYLSNLGSATGTYLNGMPVTSPIMIKPGDVISISRYQFEFDYWRPTPQISTPSGETIGGRYTLMGKVGAGGMSTIFQARDIRLYERIVVVKRLENPGSEPEYTQAFENEASILSRLDHPNIVKVYDFIRENQNLYLIMELVEGQSLDNTIDANPEGLPAKRVLIWAQQMCNGLHYLHTRQPPVIFRDVKPGNIILLPNDKIKFIDFGISRLYKPGNNKDTVSFGTPGYAAPEQYGKSQSSPATDVFGLGATLYHLLTGYNPVNNPFNLPPIQTLKPNLSLSITNAIQKAMNMNPIDRFQSTLEFWVALSLESQVVAASPIGKKGFWNRLQNLIKQ